MAEQPWELRDEEIDSFIPMVLERVKVATAGDARAVATAAARKMAWWIHGVLRRHEIQGDIGSIAVARILRGVGLEPWDVGG